MVRIERTILLALLVAAISGGVVMYREVGEIRSTVIAISENVREATAEMRGEVRQINRLILNHERRPHGQRTP